jgi:glycosyltransferase involved in cell wall biosynthesis
MTKQQTPLVSIIVPAFNEAGILEQNLAEICRYMETLDKGYSWEMLVVNDGSTDATGDIADTFAAGRENVRVLHHMFNFRLGQALRYAINTCRGDYVVVLDVDLSYAPRHIGEMLAKIRETRAKVVIASPYRKDGKVSNVPWLRKILSRWANRFLCLMASRDRYSDKISNITGMVRAYDGPFLRRLNLKATDVNINPEIIYKAKILRARIVEVPAHLHWRNDPAESKSVKRVSSLRLIRSTIQSLFSGFIFRPFAFFVFPGTVILVLALNPIVWTLIHTVKFYRELSNFSSIEHRLSEAIGMAFMQSPHAFIVGGIALLVGIQFITLGLLAFQQKRYFEETFHLGSTLFRIKQNEILSD